MTGECPNCRPGVTCAACLDFAHTAHLASGFDRARGCVRCEPLPFYRAGRVHGVTADLWPFITDAHQHPLDATPEPRR